MRDLGSLSLGKFHKLRDLFPHVLNERVELREYRGFSVQTFVGLSGQLTRGGDDNEQVS